MIDWFGLDGIGKSPSRFDFVKLENLNGHYMRHTADEQLVRAFWAFLPHVTGGPQMLARMDAPMRAKLKRAMPGLKERAKTLIELMKSSQFLFAQRPLALDDKARQIMADGGATELEALLPVLSQADWNAQPRGCGQGACGSNRRQARQARDAVACRIDRNKYVTWYL